MVDKARWEEHIKKVEGEDMMIIDSWRKLKVYFSTRASSDLGAATIAEYEYNARGQLPVNGWVHQL